MQRNLRLVGILVLVLLVGVTSVMAGRSSLSRPNLPTGSPGQMYDRAMIWYNPNGTAPVDLPSPGDEDGSGQNLLSHQENVLYAPHNTELGPSTLGPTMQKRFTASTGRSITLPKKQVDRQITKLIKRFD